MSRPNAPAIRPRRSAPLLTTPTTAMATRPSVKNSAALNVFTTVRAIGIVANRNPAPTMPPRSEEKYAADSATPALP